VTTGLSGRSAFAAASFDLRQWRRQAAAACGALASPGTVPLATASGNAAPAGPVIRAVGTRWHPVLTVPAFLFTRRMVIVGAKRRMILLATDDYSAVSRRVPLSNLYEQGRSLGLGVMVSAQSWQGLGRDDDERNRIAATADPGHVRASVREDHITTAISGLLDTYFLGCDHAAMLADRLPKTAAEEQANREARAADLTRRIARNEAAQKGLMTEFAELGDASSPASTAYRQWIREHFNQLFDDTATLQAQLDDLASTVTDADLIVQLPYAPALLIEAPDEIREALCAAFEVHCTYRADQDQMTIRATITDSTPGIVAALAAAVAAHADTAKRSPDGCAGSQAVAPAAADGTAKRSPSACADLRPAGIAIMTPETFWERGRATSRAGCSRARPPSPGCPASPRRSAGGPARRGRSRWRRPRSPGRPRGRTA
jgi:hypothetical protein